MGFLSGLLSGGVGEIAGAARDVAEIFTTSDREKLAAYSAETARIRTEQATQLAQIRANEAQARHPSLFVAGARPAVIWICAAAMAYHFLVYTLAGPFVEAFTGIALYKVDWAELSVALGGLLGFGGARTYEKIKGVARENLR